MTELYFIRHGQSDANLTRRFAGQTDAPLTSLGFLQAETTAEYFHNIKLDFVVASPLSRAYNTGYAVAERFNIPIEEEPRFMEIFAGEWEGISFDEIKEKYPESYNTWTTDIGNAVCDGGESVKELLKRVKEGVDELVLKNPGKKIAVALHATPIRVMETVWRELDITEAKNIPWVTNASVTTVIYENGKGKMIKRSEDGHLSGVGTEAPVNI